MHGLKFLYISAINNKDNKYIIAKTWNVKNIEQTKD